eukprot:5274105-Pyramimonas_sp.AAC.1
MKVGLLLIGDFNIADGGVDNSTTDLRHVRGRLRRPGDGAAGSAAARSSAGRRPRSGQSRWKQVFRQFTELVAPGISHFR